MTIPFSCKEIQLLLCKIGVDHGKWNTVESAIPCSKERILPRVGHRENVVTVHVPPLLVSNGLAVRRRCRRRWITIRPLVPDEQIVLLCPHHSRERLALDVAQIVRHGERADSVVELVCFISALVDDFVKLLLIEIALIPLGKAQTNNYKSLAQCVEGTRSLYLPAHSPGLTPPSSLKLNQAPHFVPV